jgi:hypothetical protein
MSKGKIFRILNWIWSQWKSYCLITAILSMVGAGVSQEVFYSREWTAYFFFFGVGQLLFLWLFHWTRSLVRWVISQFK